MIPNQCVILAEGFSESDSAQPVVVVREQNLPSDEWVKPHLLAGK